MNVAFLMSGGAPRLQNFQIAQTVNNVGIPLLASTGAEPGLDEPTTINASDMVGINYDTATFVTAQQTDGTSAERTVRVCINPDAVLKARLSGDGTTGTALGVRTVTAADAAGTVVTTDDDWTNPSYDSGAIWGYSGANTGQLRKITSVGVTAATVTVPFDQDTVVGDEFLRAPFWPGDLDSDNVTLTSDFREVDASAAVSAAAAVLVPIQLLFQDKGGEGDIGSFVLLQAGDHHFGPRLT